MSLPRDRAIENLRTSRYFGRLQPWRSRLESELIKRLVFQWAHQAAKYQQPLRGHRRFARQLGISHRWLQKLLKRFLARPEALQEIVRKRGMASPEMLGLAIAQTYDLRERGQLRRKIRWHNPSDEERRLERKGHRYRLENRGRFD